MRWLAGSTVAALSVPTSRVPDMDLDDVVEPGDAAVQALLALTAEKALDPEKHDLLMDAILTLPSLTEWPPESLEKLSETCRFIKCLAEDLRQMRANDS
jgi:hypothetical protein